MGDLGHRVTVVRADNSLGEYSIGATFVIGRTPECDLQLEDPQMSRRHATLTSEGRDLFITDTSTNGVILNGVKLAKNTPVQVLHGSIVNVAGFDLHFVVGEEQIDDTKQITPAEVASVESSPSAAPVAEAAEVAVPEEEEAKPDKGILINRGQVPVWEKGEVVLTVSDIIEETDDVKTFRMVGEEQTLFCFKPGQFATLMVDIDGKAVKRSYSISSSPSRPHTLEMTIKRVPGGLVSNWMNDNVKLGDKLRIKGPAGKFSCYDYPSQKMLFIGAGSGCTPIMSMARWIVDTAADVDVVMLISARTPSDIIFRKELELLAARHSGFKVHLTVTGGWRSTEGWTGYTGRCTGAMIQMVAPDYMDRHVFMCGPKPFSDATKEILKEELGFPLANLHTESFGSGRKAAGSVKKEEVADVPQHQRSETFTPEEVPPPVQPAAEASPLESSAASAPAAEAAPAESVAAAEPPASEPAAEPEPAAGFQITFQEAGVSLNTDGNATILELAENNGIEIDYDCRVGACCSCQVRCASGDVDMDEDAAIDDDDREAGYILACCSTPTSDVVIEA